MKIVLIPFFLLAIANLYSQTLSLTERMSETERSSTDYLYWYILGGVTAIVSKVSLGYRFQKGKFGGDISLNRSNYSSWFF